MSLNNNMQTLCNLCPRNCLAPRNTDTPGFCNTGATLKLSHVGKHMWEEPCISGVNGSGAIFFSGCNMRCVYCQNSKISRGQHGRIESVESLCHIMLQLQSDGVHTINLVTPSHFSNQIAASLEMAKKRGLTLPVVYNTNGYETVEALRRLHGLIDVYLPDIKFFHDSYSILYANTANYFLHCSRAVLEMHRQVGDCLFGDDSIIQKGLIIRLLVLPNLRKECFAILDWIAENLPKSTYISILAQYTPLGDAHRYKELNRKITSFEYDSVVDYFFKLGFINGYTQQRSAATDAYVPAFSYDIPLTIPAHPSPHTPL